MLDLGKVEPVMPIGPGPGIELAGLGMAQDRAQNLITDKAGKGLNVGIVANIHDLGDDTLRQQNCLIRGFPPDIFSGERL